MTFCPFSKYSDIFGNANTGVHQSWSSFVQSLASWAPAFATTFNLSNSYQVIQNFIYIQAEQKH